MREKFLQLASSKKGVQINFAASSGNKLVSVSGTIQEVGDDFILLHDIYGNTMLIPVASIAFVEIKK